MKNRLILVEGIPGAGKTTMAKSIAKDLSSKGMKVKIFEEGMSHPVDMAWQAYLTEEEYNSFIEKCYEVWENTKKEVSKEELKNIIERQVRREDGHVLLAYTKIEFPEVDYWQTIGEVANKEVCDGRTSLKEFKEIHLKRWSNFAKESNDDDTVYVFECVFLQNHIFELLGVYEKSDSEILEYLKDLISCVKVLDPKIVYIRPESVEEVLMNAAEERKSPDGSRPDWIDEIANWVSSMNYGKNHNLKGTEGVISFCKERLRIDEYVINNLEIPVEIIKRGK